MEEKRGGETERERERGEREKLLRFPIIHRLFLVDCTHTNAHTHTLRPVIEAHVRSGAGRGNGGNGREEGKKRV